jgi:hypothetical protein
MKVLVMIKGDGADEGKIAPNDEMFAVMNAYNEQLVNAGIMLGGEGLKPSSAGAKVVFAAEGGTSVVDGPFTEAKELIAGYTLIEAASLADVVELVKRWPKADGRGNVTIEIRRVTDAVEFETATPEIVERVRRMHAATGRN